MAYSIDILPTRTDNWIHLIRGEDGGPAVVIDPGEALPVLRAIERHRLKLDWLLLTHHHGDHTAGVEELLSYTECRIAGPEDLRLPVPDLKMEDGEQHDFSGVGIEGLSVPGHTRTHLAFHAHSLSAVWTGDCLFAAGCGRIMEGDARQMWASLCRLAALPLSTRVYPGHDYTVENLQFALSVVADDEAVTRRLARAKAAGVPLTSTIEEELKTNPFLRCASAEYRRLAGLGDLSAVAAFTELRRRKDHWV